MNRERYPEGTPLNYSFSNYNQVVRRKNKDALEKLESYQTKESITGSVKKAEDESINKVRKQIEVKKIQNSFRNKAKFDLPN